MSSIKKLAIRGTIWTIAGYGASQILRFGSNLILTRLIAPDVFGLMNLVFVFITGLHLFSDIGIGPSIVQNKRGDDPVFLNTAWTMQVIRGFCLWLCCLLIAWPVATLYGKPELLQLLPVVGVNTLIGAFNSTALFTLNRQIAVAKLAIFELGGQIASLTVMITLAWFYHNVWALVIANLVSSIIQMVWSQFLISGARNRFTWDRDAVKSIFSFGKWIFVSTALTFMAEKADQLILGGLVSLADLGVYGIAFALSDIPRQVLMAVSFKVLFPAFSKFADLPRASFRAKLLQNRQPFLIAATLGLTCLAGFGDQLIMLLYPKAYQNAAWMLPLLAIGFWPRILTQTIDQALFAIGKPRYSAYGSFFKFLFMVIGLPLGYKYGGLLGAIIIVTLNDLPFYGSTIYGLVREGLSCVMQDIKATALFLALLAVVVMGRLALGFGLPIGNLFFS